MKDRAKNAAIWGVIGGLVYIIGWALINALIWLFNLVIK